MLTPSLFHILMKLKVLFFLIFLLEAFAANAQKEDPCKGIYYSHDNLEKTIAFNGLPIIKTKFIALFSTRKTKLKISFIKKEDNYLEFRLISKRRLIRNKMYIGTEQPIAFVFSDKSFVIVNFTSNPLVVDEKSRIPFVKRKHDYNTIPLQDELLKLLITKTLESVEIRNPYQNNPNIIKSFNTPSIFAKEIQDVASCFSEAKHSSK